MEVDQLPQKAVHPAAQAAGADRLRVFISDHLPIAALLLGHWLWIPQLCQELTGRHLEVLLVSRRLAFLVQLPRGGAPSIGPEMDLLHLG